MLTTEEDPIDANNLAQGQSFIARIKATNPGTFGTRLENMALRFNYLPDGRLAMSD